jgi:hypothetical protein
MQYGHEFLGSLVVVSNFALFFFLGTAPREGLLERRCEFASARALTFVGVVYGDCKPRHPCIPVLVVVKLPLHREGAFLEARGAIWHVFDV